MLLPAAATAQTPPDPSSSGPSSTGAATKSKALLNNSRGDSPVAATPPANDSAAAAPAPARKLTPPTETGATTPINIEQRNDAVKAERSLPPRTFEQQIAERVIEHLKKKPGRLNDAERTAISDHYSATNPHLLWTERSGPTTKASTLIGELQNADAYALNPQHYKTVAIEEGNTTPEYIANVEFSLTRAALVYARHAKAGRIKAGQVGSQLTQNPRAIPPADVLTTLTSSSDVAQTLQRFHPTHPQFVKLHDKLMELTGRSSDGPVARIPASGPVLKKGLVHEHVGVLRTRLKVPATEGADPNSFDDALEAAVIAFQKKSGTTADGIVGPGTKRALNGEQSSAVVEKIKINMERWRWLPDNMYGEASVYVWVNLPEFRVRVIKNDAPVFSQRAIVGLVTHKTPVFSDEIEWIEIHPTWFVPDSIKVNDILPSLRRPTSTVIKRYNLKLNCGAHGTDASKIDWSKVDIRKCSFTQPAGTKSVLGDFKFKFPNKHSVYMHDTPKQGLFATKRRAYSHGCVRVKNPREMAAVLFEADGGMSAAELERIVKGPKKLRTEKLKVAIPVHMTYFTASFDDDGNFVIHPDVYGHDGRLRAALSGRAPPPKNVAAKTSKAKKKKTAQQGGWWDALLPAN